MTLERSRNTLLIGSVVMAGLLAVTFGYYYWPRQANTSGEPVRLPAGPSAEVVARVKSHAPSEIGRRARDRVPDATAAAAVRTASDGRNRTQQFVEAKRCLRAGAAIDGFEGPIRDCEGYETDGSNAARQTWCADLIKGSAAARQKLLTAFDGCSNDPAVREADYYQAMTQAAEAGDTGAQLCWTEGWWHASVSYATYEPIALHYFDEAMARGDWRFVWLMAQRYVDNAPRSSTLLVYGRQPPGHQVTTTDWSVNAYRMNRLMRLGAVGDLAKWVDNLAEISELSKTQIDAANNWAETEYLAHFTDQPLLNALPVSCHTSDLDTDSQDSALHPWRGIPSWH